MKNIINHIPELLPGDRMGLPYSLCKCNNVCIKELIDEFNKRDIPVTLDIDKDIVVICKKNSSFLPSIKTLTLPREEVEQAGSVGHVGHVGRIERA